MVGIHKNLLHLFLLKRGKLVSSYLNEKKALKPVWRRTTSRVDERETGNANTGDVWLATAIEKHRDDEEKVNDVGVEMDNETDGFRHDLSHRLDRVPCSGLEGQ